MSEFAAPENGEVISGRTSFKTTAKSVGKQTLTKQLGTGSKKTRILPTKSTKQSSREETFLQTFFVDHVKQVSVPAFCGGVLKSLRESTNC